MAFFFFFEAYVAFFLLKEKRQLCRWLQKHPRDPHYASPRADVNKRRHKPLQKLYAVLSRLPWSGLSVLFPTHIHVAERESLYLFELDLCHRSFRESLTSQSGGATVTLQLKTAAIHLKSLPSDVTVRRHLVSSTQPSISVSWESTFVSTFL